MPTRVIAVTGGKGGVGKSTTTVNLGVSLRMDGYSVALVDADVEMPNLVELLGLDPKLTIHDVLSGDAGPLDALQEVGPEFVVMPGDPALSGYGAIEPERMESVVHALAYGFDVILLDTGAGLSYDDLFPIGLADEIILVSSPDPAAVQNAMRTKSFVERLNRQVRGVVITMADGEVDASVAERFGAQLLGVIPEDDAVRYSTAEGQPLELYAPNSAAAAAYRQLEATLTDGVLPPRRTDTSQQEQSAEEADDAADEAADASAEAATDGEGPLEPEVEGPATAEEAEEARRRGGLLSRLVRFVT